MTAGLKHRSRVAGEGKLESGARDHSHLLYLVYLVAFLDMFSASMIVTLLPSYLTVHRGLSTSAAGLIGSIYGLVQFWSSPLVGGLGDLLGYRRVLSVCLCLSSAAYFLLVSEWLAVLLAARFLAGCVKHTQNQCKTAVSAVATEHEKLTSFGRLNSMGNFAFIIAPALAGRMATSDGGYSSVFVLTALVFAFNAAVVHFTFPYDLDVAETNNNSLKSSSNNGLVALIIHVDWASQWDLMVVRFLQTFVVLLYRGSFTWLVSEWYHADPQTIGYLSSFQGAVSFATSFYANRIIEYWWYPDGVRAMRDSMALLSTAFVGMWLLSPSVYWYALWLLLLNVASSLLRVACLDLTVERCDRSDYGLIIGTGASVTSAARAVAPAIGGLLYDINFQLPTVASALLSFVSLLVLVVQTPINQRRFTKNV